MIWITLREGCELSKLSASLRRVVKREALPTENMHAARVPIALLFRERLGTVVCSPTTSAPAPRLQRPTTKHSLASPSGVKPGRVRRHNINSRDCEATGTMTVGAECLNLQRAASFMRTQTMAEKTANTIAIAHTNRTRWSDSCAATRGGGWTTRRKQQMSNGVYRAQAFFERWN